MSGHSKWSSIKHQKGAADAKRGQLFTRLAREIIVAVRAGGPSPEANFRLRLAVQKARDANMPLDNIDRAIRKGSGEGGGAALQEFILEGYGPGGTAILVQVMTDNRLRALQEVRNAFTRHGGSLGESGCVAWLFQSRGMITVKGGDRDVEELELKAIDAGAEDVQQSNGDIEIYTKPEETEAVRKALEAAGVHVDSSELSMVAKTLIKLEEKPGLQALKLLDRLEELDDVNGVYSNADFSPEILAKHEAEAQSASR
ncbi:MAG: YebC/PmpR family DNA-binding transcriptional regulator [Dehalococcoidia bacterium]|jgi:YebC/PmpR family DNA-binding regulatory protein|nr:MAG: YebC/PmpR family DNA-binding transcriptional regulator [Dehalococcoidia bacterium]